MDWDLQPAGNRAGVAPAAAALTYRDARILAEHLHTRLHLDEGTPIIAIPAVPPSEEPARRVRPHVSEAKLSPRGQPAPDAIHWTCPHGRHAGKGCVACYEASTDADPALPLWRIAVWFTSERPMPIRVLKDVRRHGRNFALDQPSTPLVYLLSGQARAATSAEAIAGLVGFLVGNRHIVDAFTVTEIRAVIAS